MNIRRYDVSYMNTVKNKTQVNKCKIRNVIYDFSGCDFYVYFRHCRIDLVLVPQSLIPRTRSDIYILDISFHTDSSPTTLTTFLSEN